MQDWSMIPLHIRCTQRERINPDYPHDDAVWWQQAEAFAKWADRHRSASSYLNIPRSVLEYANSIRENRHAFELAAGACRVSLTALASGVRDVHRYRKGREQKPLEEMSEREIALDAWLQKEEG